jgi:hypothetical protein
MSGPTLVDRPGAAMVFAASGRELKAGAATRRCHGGMARRAGRRAVRAGASSAMPTPPIRPNPPPPRVRLAPAR